MAEWVIEDGIGETRAVLIDGDTILETRIVPADELVAGTILSARLVTRFVDRSEGLVTWDGGEAIVAPLPRGVTEGATTLVEILRPPIPERGKPKRARARPAAPDAAPGTGTPLDESLTGAHRLRHTDPDLLEAAGWSELLEEAATGIVRFPGGQLTITLTPAMTLIDIDGTLGHDALAVTGATEAARAIRRLDLAGSIGLDLPGASRAARQAAAEAVDAILPQPFERTAVNGFGFLQIVRRRSRRSLPELYAMEPALAHARALLRQAERSTGAGERSIVAHPSVIAELAARPDWIATLARRIGATIALQADPARAISAGHVQARHP